MINHPFALTSYAILFTFSSIGVQGYGDPQVGPCRGPGGVNDKVNNRHAAIFSLQACEDACTDLPACVGYAHCSVCNSGECILYGPGVDGTCSDPSAKNAPACEAIGSCADTSQLSEDECGTCSEPTATSKTTCDVVGGTWTIDVWTSANEVWSDADDPWTGESHHSTVIDGTTGEASSNYICVDADPDDHLAHCTGTDQVCTFDGLPEADRTQEKCPDGCTFTPAPVLPSNKPPHAGDIQLPGWNAAMSGACRGGPNQADKVNGKYSNTAGADGKLTQLECANACLDEPECIGYAHSTAWCVVYGPMIHRTPGDGWVGDNHVSVEITGTKPNAMYICVTGPPRATDNNDSDDGGMSNSNDDGSLTSAALSKNQEVTLLANALLQCFILFVLVKK